MKTTRYSFDAIDMRTIRFFRQITKLPLILIVGCLIFNGCAALEEAQQLREAREKEKRNKEYLMLAPSKGEIKIAEDAQKAESTHYTITFGPDLKEHEDFDENSERGQFLESALGYMESLYNEMNTIFGFQPEHKIHVTLHDVYNESRNLATTTTQYRYESKGNTSLKYVTGIKMDFPLAMYKKPDVRAHELTHAFTNIYFLPTWFNEGIAVLMQTEWAKGGSHPKFDNLETNVKRNLDGVNDLEDWEFHGGSSRLLQWRYSYAYTIVSELRKRFGPDYYIKVFQLMEADQLHSKLPSKMSTSFLIYYLNQAAETDLIPFFESLHFKVRRLTKEDILQNIRQTNR
ncbi:hypothetical protein J4G08_12830 [Candidatus Poribacteria bacterium]|nr:hypothetical protein [Candidatus Poribacteria bacterium]